VQLRVLVHLQSGLLVAAHATGQDKCLRLASALREASLDEKEIESFLHVQKLPRCFGASGAGNSGARR
jgi:hypothetical protein